MIVQPPFPEFLPESPWCMPTEFPDLSRAKRIQIDCETKDPLLTTMGPGFLRKDAFVAGVAVATDDGFSGYYPVRHLQGQNFAPNAVFSWLKDQLKYDQEKIGANLLYDFEALHSEGIDKIGGRWSDIQVAEPLIDEETAEGYSLEVLAMKYVGEGKEEKLLREVSHLYKSGFKGKRAISFDAKKDLWALPPQYVGGYAEGDVRLPGLILEKQRKEMDAQDLKYIWELESDLIPILLKMRLHGIAVDLEKAEALAKTMGKAIDELSINMKKLIGFDIDIGRNEHLQRAYEKLKYMDDALEIHLAYTDKGNVSFNKAWLSVQTDPLSRMIMEKRKLAKMKKDFIEGSIIKMSVNGRVHAQFHQLRQDDNGTRTGRFSSTHPNLQQIPARDEVWAPLIRALFIADEFCQWLKADYSQQEPRLLVHYASQCKLKGADLAVAAFHKDPRTDYHVLTTEIVNKYAVVKRVRKQIKGVNLGVMYSMGLAKLCRQLNVPIDEGKQILEDYHRALPFVRGLSNKAMAIAQDRGFIRTLLGRRRRFDLWEPSKTYLGEDNVYAIGLPYDQAKKKWPSAKLQRFGIHKALNALIQGSAADQTKHAMRVLYQVHGIVIQLQVHDELGKSVASFDEARTIKRTMETCIQLDIPVVADSSVGPSWGEAEEKIYLEAA